MRQSVFLLLYVPLVVVGELAVLILFLLLMSLIGLDRIGTGAMRLATLGKR